MKDQYAKNLAEVTNTKNSDGLSGMDKMEMNLNKIDEGLIILSENNISSGTKKIMKMIDVEIGEDEIDYYRKYHNPNKLQVQLVYSYYAKYFGGYRDLNLINRREYIILLLLLKKKLLIENGYSNKINGVSEYVKLPYILTGNVEAKMNTRIIRNNKFINKIEDNYIFQNLINKKYKYLHQIKKDYILSLLSTIINTTFTYVTFEDHSMLGKEITYSEDKISDELLFFLNNI